MSEVDPELAAAMQRRFEANPLHVLLGIAIEPYDDDRPDWSAATMAIGPNAYGSVTDDLHGGAIATLVDVACASAAARALDYQPGDTAIVTHDMHVRYLGRARGQVARCDARVVKAGRRSIVVDGTVTDDLGTVVAVCDFSFMVVEIKR